MLGVPQAWGKGRGESYTLFQTLPNNPVLPRLYTSYDKLAYFKMAIEQMDYYDLQPTPPIFKHFDLENQTEGNGFAGERFNK